jgi:TrmH family RNA methyltransferase
MEHLTSRKNPNIVRFRALAADRAARREAGEYVCDGLKLLREAIQCGAELGCVLWGGEPPFDVPDGVRQLTAPPELLRYASPLLSSPGPLFTVKIPAARPPARPRRAVVLEDVQDPGNVGTVLRTANALGIGLVVLTGVCADPYSPKTVRAAMGALFRQGFLELGLGELAERLREWELPLYGAALSDKARDLRTVRLQNAAIAIGNEGRGLSGALLDLCDGELIIPMSPGSESLNAACAAAIFLWELSRS